MKAALHFFLKDGLSKAVFNWLNFRLFVANNKLKLPIIDNTSPQTQSPDDLLAQWQKQQFIVSPSPWLYRILSLLMIMIGFTTMATVLNYNVNNPINIWLPLALFAFVPFLLTLSSFYFSVIVSPKHIDSHPLLSILVKKLNLSPFLSYKNLLLPWLFWQSQKLALLFSISGLTGFFILATFQDYRFAWSSTLITDNTTMTQLMAILSWPWHWFIASPSAELISQSRVVILDATFQAGSGETWWLTLVMAIIVYGIFPRLMLALLLRQHLVKKLRWSIIHSGDIEQFLVAQSHQVSHNPLSSDHHYASPETIDIERADVDLITWQQPDSTLATIKNLGNDDWQLDEQWLNSPNSQREKPLLILVDIAQTPTGELADCIALLQRQNTVDLVLLNPTINDERYQSQLKSWQFFAVHHQLILKQAS